MPVNLRVFLAVDWVEKHLVNVEFKPLSQIEISKKKQVYDCDMLPELILGESMPKSAVKWTKDVRLLYGYKKGLKCVKFE